MEQILSEVVTAKREFPINNDVSLAKKRFHNIRSFQTHLPIIDQRCGEICPHDLRSSTIDIRNMADSF